MLEDVQEAVEEGRAQPKSRLRRHLAYYARARRYVFGRAMPSIRVEVDGALIAEDAAVVTVANVECQGRPTRKEFVRTGWEVRRAEGQVLGESIRVSSCITTVNSDRF